jgi:hypothetical protein
MYTFSLYYIIICPNNILLISHITSMFVSVCVCVYVGRIPKTDCLAQHFLYSCRSNVVGCALHCEWQHWQFRKNLNLCGDMQTKKIIQIFGDDKHRNETETFISKTTFLVRCGGHTSHQIPWVAETRWSTTVLGINVKRNQILMVINTN